MVYRECFSTKCPFGRLRTFVNVTLRLDRVADPVLAHFP